MHPQTTILLIISSASLITTIAAGIYNRESAGSGSFMAYELMYLKLPSSR